MSKINLDEIPTKGKEKRDGPKVFYLNFKEGEQGYEQCVTIEGHNKRVKDAVGYLLEKYI